jgi:lipopolysaccharide biosynthesis glycosyltransferase
MKKVFIHTNNKQGIGAILSKFSIERFLSDKEISVEYINVDQLPVFKNFVGKKYLRNGKEMVYNPNDLQSFTLSRFMPPELMNYSGRAVVIDPDIFSIKDISSLFTLDLKGSPIADCGYRFCACDFL